MLCHITDRAAATTWSLPPRDDLSSLGIPTPSLPRCFYTLRSLLSHGVDDRAGDLPRPFWCHADGRIGNRGSGSGLRCWSSFPDDILEAASCTSLLPCSAFQGVLVRGREVISSRSPGVHHCRVLFDDSTFGWWWGRSRLRDAEKAPHGLLLQAEGLAEGNEVGKRPVEQQGLLSGRVKLLSNYHPGHLHSQPASCQRKEWQRWKPLGKSW
jgi:hypothetical protein